MRQLLLLAALIAGAAAPAASQVVRHPDPAAPLAERWSWALDACNASSCVAGYAVRRRMHAEDRMGWIGDWKDSRRTLADVLSGGTVPTASGSTGMVDKPVALLFRFERGASEPTEVRASTFDAWIDLEGAPLLWLGSAGLEASVAHLDARFERARNEDVRRGLVWAVGMHQLPDRVVPWLTNVATTDDAVEVRKAATYALSDQPADRALPILERIVRDDASTEVRKAALYAAADLDGPGAFRLLASTARNASMPTEIRKAAINALGDIESDEVKALLVDIAMNGGLRP